MCSLIKHWMYCRSFPSPPTFHPCHGDMLSFQFCVTVTQLTWMSKKNHWWWWKSTPWEKAMHTPHPSTHVRMPTQKRSHKPTNVRVPQKDMPPKSIMAGGPRVLFQRTQACNRRNPKDKHRSTDYAPPTVVWALPIQTYKAKVICSLVPRPLLAPLFDYLAVNQKK